MKTGNNMKTYVLTGILLTFSFYLLPVKAANLAARSTQPLISFDDTDVTGTEWTLTGDQGAFYLFNQETFKNLLVFYPLATMLLEMQATTFQIKDNLGNTIVNVHRDAPLSLEIQANGDVSLAGGDVFIDTATNRLGIGTTAPGAAIHLSAATPQILFDDSNEVGSEWLMDADQDRFSLYNYDTSKSLLYFDDLATMQLEMLATTFQIEDEANNPIVSVHRDAPLSLDIQADGDVSLAGGDVFIDTSLNYLGIGTTAPAAPIHFRATWPQILFDDSDEAGVEWLMRADQNTFSLYNYDTAEFLLWFDDLADMQLDMSSTAFRIQDQSGNNIVNVHRDAPLSLDIRSTGDVALAGGDVFIDTSANRVGIGTSVPLSDLGIKSPAPGIYLDDTTAGSADWFVGNEANDFVVKIQDNATGGPATTRIMTLDAQTGYIGMNKDTPVAALHVGSPDGVSAKVLVENTTAVVAPRTLFELQNAGNTKFTVNNTDAGVQWSFANPGTAFRLSRQGSGFVEFEIFNNGDATLKGALTQNSDVNAKQDIEAIDSAAILAKVVAMPINEWSYKDAPDTRHLGPMAQDFRAAFGLGNTDTGIATLDSSGVALAAIQALNGKLVAQNLSLAEQNQSMEQRVIELEQQNQEMAEQNQRIEELVMQIVTGQAEQLAIN